MRQEIDLSIAGGSDEYPVRNFNYQRCINYYPVLPAENSRGGLGGLMPTPGLTELVDLGGSEIRALFKAGDNFYAVCDSSLYNIGTDGTGSTLVGTLATNTGIVNVDINPTQAMLVDNSSTGYILTYATDAFAEIADASFTGAQNVCFIDSYFLYNTPDAATIYATNINDGTSIDSLDVVTAEALPDKVVTIASDKRELWVFGEHSVEIYYDAANATGFPFSRRDGAFIDIGCGAKDSVKKINNTLVWLDNRGYVVAGMGYQPKILSTEAISAQIASFSTFADARAFVLTEQGHEMYCISFPTAERTFVYDFATNMWHERAFWNGTAFEHHLANVSVRNDSAWYVGARSSGKIFQVDKDAFLDGTHTIRRLRTSSHIQYKHKLIGVDELVLSVAPGLAAEGVDADIELRYSNDGGYTWSSSIARSLGDTGEYSKQVNWTCLGTARDWLFEFSTAAEASHMLIDAVISIEVET